MINTIQILSSAILYWGCIFLNSNYTTNFLSGITGVLKRIYTTYRNKLPSFQSKEKRKSRNSHSVNTDVFTTQKETSVH
jgi:hypothetical protein